MIVFEFIILLTVCVIYLKLNNFNRNGKLEKAQFLETMLLMILYLTVNIVVLENSVFYTCLTFVTYMGILSVTNSCGEKKLNKKEGEQNV